MDNKLALGTVQFGLDYGIANKEGKIREEEVFMILDLALSEGINTLDTAYSYGNSEKLVGRFILEKKADCKIISKMPDLEGKGASTARKYLLETLARLKQDRIYGYLVHNFDNIHICTGLFEELRSFKEEGLVEKNGLSIYKTEELEYLLNNDIDLDIIQVPYSVFDRRFEKYFPVLKERGAEIHTRSVFLQGLVFCQSEDLTGELVNADPYLQKLRKLSEKNNIPVDALCLNFVLSNPDIDKVFVGVDNLRQFKKNLQSITLFREAQRFVEELKEVSINGENKMERIMKDLIRGTVERSFGRR